MSGGRRKATPSATVGANADRSPGPAAAAGQYEVGVGGPRYRGPKRERRDEQEAIQRRREARVEGDRKAAEVRARIAAGRAADSPRPAR